MTWQREASFQDEIPFFDKWSSSLRDLKGNLGKGERGWRTVPHFFARGGHFTACWMEESTPMVLFFISITNHSNTTNTANLSRSYKTANPGKSKCQFGSPFQN